MSTNPDPAAGAHENLSRRLVPWITPEEKKRLIASGLIKEADPRTRATKKDLERAQAELVAPPLQDRPNRLDDAIEAHDDTGRNLHDYQVLAELVNKVLEDVAKKLEADRLATLDQLRTGEGKVPSGLSLGFDRSIAIVRASKK